MKVLVDIGHPAHVHQFRNVISNLLANGHQVKVTAREKEITFRLLDAYGIEYEPLGKPKKGLARKMLATPIMDQKLFRVAKDFGADVLVGGSGNLYVAHVGWFLEKRSVIFEDSEPEQKHRLIYEPMVSQICVPTCFKGRTNEKYYRFAGYKELAYLHPNHFKPDPCVTAAAGLVEGERFVIMRFVGWTAGHDSGLGGIDPMYKKVMIMELEHHARVLISSESLLPPELERYKINLRPEQMHDLLASASLLVTDGQTMATEAAVLGVPVVRSCDFVGTMSNFEELEKTYDMIYSFGRPEPALAKALELIKNPDTKKEWAAKREKLLADKINVADWMYKFIVDGPKGFGEVGK